MKKQKLIFTLMVLCVFLVNCRQDRQENIEMTFEEKIQAAIDEDESILFAEKLLNWRIEDVSQNIVELPILGSQIKKRFALYEDIKTFCNQVKRKNNFEAWVQCGNRYLELVSDQAFRTDGGTFQAVDLPTRVTIKLLEKTISLTPLEYLLFQSVETAVYEKTVIVYLIQAKLWNKTDHEEGIRMANNRIIERWNTVLNQNKGVSAIEETDSFKNMSAEHQLLYKNLRAKIEKHLSVWKNFINNWQNHNATWNDTVEDWRDVYSDLD